MAARRCKAMTKKGKRCKARALKGSDYCVAHEPVLAGQRVQWRRAGGRASSKKATLEEAEALETPGEIKKLLAKTISAVENGNIDPKTANAIARLCNLQLKAIKETDTARRLARLERVVGQEDIL